MPEDGLRELSFVKRKTNKNQGQFVPRNPHKYTGRYPIVVRSSWERMFCQWLDVNQSVIAWTSEGVVIPYYDPIQQKRRRYYPDFWMKVNTEQGVQQFLIEIKPRKETKPPTPKGRKATKTQLYQEATWVTNQAKFEAAEKYCQKMKWNWKILTEKELFR